MICMRKLVSVSFVVLVFLLAVARTTGPGMVEGLTNVVVDHEPWPVSAATKRLHDSLVVGDLHAESRGVPRHGRLDAPLFLAPTELNQ